MHIFYKKNFMKTRNGFVSNSSTSSFIVLGIKSDKDIKAEGIESIYSEDDGYYIGVVLDDDEYLDREVSFTTLYEMAHKVSKSLSVSIDEVKLMAGTRYC